MDGGLCPHVCFFFLFYFVFIRNFVPNDFFSTFFFTIHVSKVIAVYEESDRLHIVTDLHKGGDLFDHILKHDEESSMGINEECAKSLILQILKAVQHCHRSGVAHLDLKPENFMLSQKSSLNYLPKISLIDFGMAHGFPYTNEGRSVAYCAPEALDGYFSPSSDMWSLGVMYVFLITLKFIIFFIRYFVPDKCFY
eukprot:GSMAST32.ASY1.ANO1.319.1 assembled CDS